MKNQEILNTYNTLAPLGDQKGMPVKFEYGLARILDRLEEATNPLQKLQETPVEGQEEYVKARNQLLEGHAQKDENDQPQHRTIGGQTEYVIKDLPALRRAQAELDEDYSGVLADMTERREEVSEFLREECVDFEPYIIQITNLPIKEGQLGITVAQLRVLLPFLEGDIDDLPDLD